MESNLVSLFRIHYLPFFREACLRSSSQLPSSPRSPLPLHLLPLPTLPLSDPCPPLPIVCPPPTPCPPHQPLPTTPCPPSAPPQSTRLPTPCPAPSAQISIPRPSIIIPYHQAPSEFTRPPVLQIFGSLLPKGNQRGPRLRWNLLSLKER